MHLLAAPPPSPLPPSTCQVFTAWRHFALLQARFEAVRRHYWMGVMLRVCLPALDRAAQRKHREEIRQHVEHEFAFASRARREGILGS